MYPSTPPARTVSGTSLRTGAVLPSWQELALRSGLTVEMAIFAGTTMYTEDHDGEEPTDGMARGRLALWCADMAAMRAKMK
jgi:hypothetical protein